MKYKCSLNYTSLATVILLLSSPNIKADSNVYNELQEANKAINDPSVNWKEAAQHFINAFDEFSQNILDILNTKGGKTVWNTFISVELWKKGRTFPSHFPENYYLKQETINDRAICGAAYWRTTCWDTDNEEVPCCLCNPIMDLLCCIPTCGLWPMIHCIASVSSLQGSGAYYFKDHIEPYLKKYIISTLQVNSLEEAGDYWEKQFLIPVSNLLIDHSNEMLNHDSNTLQLLLDLYRTYYRSNFIGKTGTLHGCGTYIDISAVEELANFAAIYQNVYNYLANSIVNCNQSENKEYENILCCLLTQKDKGITNNNKYYKGAWEYGLDIEHLLEIVQPHSTINQETILPAISRAIEIAKDIVYEIKLDRQNKHDQQVAEAQLQAAEAQQQAANTQLQAAVCASHKIN